MSRIEPLISFIRQLYQTDSFIPLHAPVFLGNEKKYLNDCIDSTFVSSVGKFVDDFESKISDYTGAKYAIATVNGTAALHISLLLAGVEKDTEVITQATTFVATTNAISYAKACPVFVDCDKETLGLCPLSLKRFFEDNTQMSNGVCVNKKTGKRIAACVPMHTFGNPCRIDEIVQTCDAYNVLVVEDSAESLGSFYKGQHTGTFGKLGIFSFNGNKIITTGGGGVIVTDDEELAKRAKHITTTAKVPHQWEFIHDETGYNYRMPNVNAAIGCAQLETLSQIRERKKAIAEEYYAFFKENDWESLTPLAAADWNAWFTCIVAANRTERDQVLEKTNEAGVMTRPLWKLMSSLEMFKGCETDGLETAQWAEDRLVCLPSSYKELL